MLTCDRDIGVGQPRTAAGLVAESLSLRLIDVWHLSHTLPGDHVLEIFGNNSNCQERIGQVRSNGIHSIDTRVGDTFTPFVVGFIVQ
ncbi:hypothetical protein J6590_010630 [Homalodisca vitripennis]|nr:hypothetical protein J6590_010630 [Homalodisca vitripennis]